nr:S-layer homology domain-containing protein [uncultured Anaerotignum sp.]
MIKRIYSSLLALVMVVGLLPTTAWAEVTAENDWNIFKTDDYSLPETQEQILQAMIQNENFASNWATIANNVLPAQFYADDDIGRKYFDYADFTKESYNADNLKYTAKGLRDAVTQAIDNEGLRNGSNVLNKLPEGEFPVYYTSTYRKEGYSKNQYNGYHGTGHGYYVQAFYDFEIEGIQSRFKTPSVAEEDTTADLEQKGYNFSLGGSSDSYKVTAENRNDFENTVEKSYTYEKSTSTSTTVSNTYSQNWTEETTIGVEFSVPVLASFSPTAKVEQSFSYSYGMEKTYESSKEESYSQSITDTISVPLPAHTGIDINVDVTDMKTTIPYEGAVRIKYKTMLIYATGCYLDGNAQGHKWYGGSRQSGVYTFGREGRSAIEDLDARIQNRNVSGFDPDKLDMNTLYQGEFKTAADALRSGQPVAPYFGKFHYTSKNTIITPQQVYPIYALDRLVPDTEEISLYEQQSMRLDSIKVQALNEHYVAWYGFNPRLSGEWTVVDEDGNDASEYAEITTNRNGYPLLQALKPNDGKELFLRYEPKSSIDTTDAFNSELIELTIKPVKLSEVTLAGEFEPFYLNDGNNKTNVAGLIVTAKDEDGNDFDVTNKVKWYAEETDGITVNETTGDISFDKAGTYQIYAVVNEKESNRVALQVLPERYLNEITVEGTIPDLTYDDDAANTFDLSSLTITGTDQYGHDYALDADEYDWRLTSDKGYAAINGNTITGLVVGMDTVTLYYPVGKDDNNETVYKQSLPITVKVVAKPYVDEFYYNDGAPNAVEGMAYNLTQIPLMARDQHGNPFNVPNDIVWKLADNNETEATLDTTAGTLTVKAGQVPNASYADVILEAYSPSIDKTARNIVVKAEQQPVLKSIKATMNESFILRLDENAKLADHFSAVGYDQYGREMQNLTFTWHTTKPDVVSLKNGTLKALKEDSTEIYATADEIESNRITLTVAAPRRLTGISVSGISSTAAKNTTFDLTKAVVKTVDQFGKEFNSDELAAYPASIRWTLEKNDTNAVIDGNTLSFGDKDGKMTLICAAVNTDTNVIVEKRIDIQIGGSSSGGSSSGGGGGGGGGGGTAKSAYIITVENTKNGEVVSSHKTADKGDTVTLTATPDKGYAIRRIIVTDSSDQKLTLTEKDGKYIFTMPSSNVTVKTTFIMDKSKDEVPNPFEDVSANSYYYDAVQWAVKNGTTGGTSATTFSPDAPCTRAQAVTFLWRAAGSPAPSSTEMPFADVPTDAYYYNAVLWAVENGITGGTSATTFSPDAPCSRGQIVAFLWRSKQSPMVAAENPFMDVNAADYYHNAVLWAAENGITGGTGANTFSPDAPCTRAQIVTFLYRALHK